jgi:predicted metal-dependent phosphoesterase TrpH
VRRLVAAGIRTCAITDHDTTAGSARAAAAAAAAGLRLITGIEITAVHDGADLHLLGYGFDPDHAELARFLETQRADRVRRVIDMIDRLATLGVSIDRRPLLEQATGATGRALGRPAIAKALVAGGHARDIGDAFERYLAVGRPAFVPRRGSAPADVIALVARAGGIVSFAHPGKLGLDDLMPALAARGLAAIEVFHPDHDAAAVARYLALARTLQIGVSGGSDYHGPKSGRAEALGTVTLPAEHFDDLLRRIPNF